jgi:hypothetical protein
MSVGYAPGTSAIRLGVAHPLKGKLNPCYPMQGEIGAVIAMTGVARCHPLRVDGVISDGSPSPLLPSPYRS